MKYYHYLLVFLLINFGCNSSKSLFKSKIFPIKTIKELQNYIDNNCRFNKFKVGRYASQTNDEEYGLDTLSGKFIWYSNLDRKVILNNFFKEDYAVKYTYTQLHKLYPKISALTLTINSKEIEEKLFEEFKQAGVKPYVVVSFNDELGYASEIEISECDAEKAETILVNYPKVQVKFKNE